MIFWGDIGGTIMFLWLVVTNILEKGIPVFINNVYYGNLDVMNMQFNEVMEAGWFTNGMAPLEVFGVIVGIVFAVVPRTYQLIGKIKKNIRNRRR